MICGREKDERGDRDGTCDEGEGLGCGGRHNGGEWECEVQVVSVQECQ